MLRVLQYLKNRLHPQISGNVSREMETLRKNKMKSLEITNTVTEVKNALGLLADSTWSQKESVNFKTSKLKILKLKHKEHKG